MWVRIPPSASPVIVVSSNLTGDIFSIKEIFMKWDSIDSEFGSLDVYFINPRRIHLSNKGYSFSINNKLISVMCRIRYVFDKDGVGSWRMDYKELFIEAPERSSYYLKYLSPKDEAKVEEVIMNLLSEWLKFNEKRIEEYTKEWIITTLIELKEWRES